MLKRYYLSTAILATALIDFDAHAMWQSDDKDANNSLSPTKSPVEKKTAVTSAKEKTDRVSSKQMATQLQDSSLPETSNVEKKTTLNPIDSIDEDEEYVKNLLSKLVLMKKDKKKHPNDKSTRFTKKGDSLLVQPYTEPDELRDVFSRNTDAKSIKVDRTYFNDELVKDLSKVCKHLTALDASFTPISDEGVKVLAQRYKGQ